MLYPFLETPAVLGDVLNRLAWSLTPRLPEGIDLLVPAAAEIGPSQVWSDLPVPEYEFNALR